MSTPNNTLLQLPVRPIALNVQPWDIPAELKALRRWVMWRYEWKDKRWTKVPYIARASYRANASVTNPTTWDTFGAAITIYQKVGGYDGIGFVLCGSDPYMGVDLDHALNDGDEIEDWAKAIIVRLPGYWEFSPSGKGLRHIRRGKLPEGGRRRIGDIEMYDNVRFLTITGHTLEGSDYDYR